MNWPNRTGRIAFIVAVASLSNVGVALPYAQPAPNPEVSQQINELVRFCDDTMNARIRIWEKPETPQTARALQLQKKAYDEVLREVLNQYLQVPLSPQQMAQLKPLLARLFKGSFEIDAHTDPPSARDEVIENDKEKVVQFWKSDGESVTKDMTWMQLSTVMEVFLAPPPSAEEKGQIKQQLAELALRVEVELLKQIPTLTQEQLKKLSTQYLKATTNDLDLPPTQLHVVLRPIPAAQWQAVLDEGLVSQQKDTERLIKNRLSLKDEKQKEDAVSMAYQTFWWGVIKRMSVAPSQQLQAKQAKKATNLGARMAAYQLKLMDRSDDLNRSQLIRSVLSEETVDREILVWLMRAGFELPRVRNLSCKATLTFPSPLPWQDEYYMSHVGDPREKGEVKVGLIYLVAPNKLRLSVDHRQGVGDNFDAFMYRHKSVLLLNGSKLTTSSYSYQDVTTLDINRKINREDIEGLRLRGGGSGFPTFDPYIKDVLTMQRASWSKAKTQGTRQVNGISCRVLELRYPYPLKVAEPHYISGSRRFISLSKGVTLRQEDFDAQNQVVSTTDFQQFRARPGQVSAPLRSCTKITAGKATYSQKRRFQVDKTHTKEETITGKVRFPGRVIYRTYQMGKGQTPLLTNLAVYDEKGRNLMQLKLSDFRFNRPLPKSAFAPVKLAALRPKA